MGKNQHVVKNGEEWGVRGEKNSRLSSIHDTQADAIKAAIRTAKSEKSDVIIHGRNGKIIDRDSYGNDPFPPRDKKH